MSRPSKRAEVRVKGLDDTVISSEVAEAIASMGKCRTDEVHVGELRCVPNGLALVWPSVPPWPLLGL